MPGVIMESWTISFWTILPMEVFETHKKHILVQSIGGGGSYVQFDEDGKRLQMIDEESGRRIDA